MKNFYLFYYMIIIFILLIISVITEATETVKYEADLVKLEVKLAVIDVKASKDLVFKLRSGLTYCKTPNNIVLSIIKNESDFKVNAFNNKSKDYGLMQINNWHVRRLNLDKNKLLIDVLYNMKHGCNILDWFYSTYKESEAVGRYNCGVIKSCVKYKSVRRYISRVLIYKARLDAVDAAFAVE